MGGSTILVSKGVLTHYHHSFRKIDAACTQDKTGMMTYLDDVHALRMDTAIILLCVTNIMSTD